MSCIIHPSLAVAVISASRRGLTASHTLPPVPLQPRLLGGPLVYKHYYIALSSCKLRVLPSFPSVGSHTNPESLVSTSLLAATCCLEFDLFTSSQEHMR
ncbi:hypothetical protein LIA77_07405 [Sarocladium implicatum]|nr:hypothetical protein LIA77_07405 [Sarocladium implicatum]